MANKGDYRLWRNTEGPIRRENIVKSKNRDASIFPAVDDYEGDVYLKDDPDKDFTFYWLYKTGGASERDEIQELKDLGYRQVTKDEWEANRFEWGPDGLLWRGGFVLYACPKEIKDKHEAEERMWNRALIERHLKSSESLDVTTAEERSTRNAKFEAFTETDVVKAAKRR